MDKLYYKHRIDSFGYTSSEVAIICESIDKSMLILTGKLYDHLKDNIIDDAALDMLVEISKATRLNEIIALVRDHRQKIQESIKDEEIDFTNIEARINIEALEKEQGDLMVVESNSDVKCPECNQRNTFVRTAQTRSGDEAVTRFYKCLNKACLNEWKRN